MSLLDVVVEDSEEVHNLPEIHLPILLLVNPLKHFLTGRQNIWFSCFGALCRPDLVLVCRLSLHGEVNKDQRLPSPSQVRTRTAGNVFDLSELFSWCLTVMALLAVVKL